MRRVKQDELSELLKKNTTISKRPTPLFFKTDYAQDRSRFRNRIADGTNVQLALEMKRPRMRQARRSYTQDEADIPNDVKVKTKLDGTLKGKGLKKKPKRKRVKRA